MAKLNGNGKWVISSVVAVVSVCLTVAGIMLAAGGRLAKVENNEKYIEQNMARIETNAARVRHCENVDAAREEQVKAFENKLDDFITEQRAVNTQVLKYLRTSNP